MKPRTRLNVKRRSITSILCSMHNSLLRTFATILIIYYLKANVIVLIETHVNLKTFSSSIKNRSMSLNRNM